MKSPSVATPDVAVLLALYEFGALQTHRVRYFDVVMFKLVDEAPTFSESTALARVASLKKAGVQATCVSEFVKFDGAFGLRTPEKVGDEELSRAQILEMLADCDAGAPHGGDQESLFLAFARLIQAHERERCAAACEIRNDELKLLAGEMSAQELRTAQAILRNRAAVIRARCAMDTAHDKNPRSTA